MLIRIASASVLALSIALSMAPTASAGGRVVCDPETRICTVIVEKPPTTGTGNGGGTVPTGNGGGGTGSNQEVLTPEEICALTQPRVNGQPVGTCGVTATGTATPGPGGGPAAPTVTPAQVAQMAVSQLPLRRPKIGSAPCTTAGCKGTVGVPVWVWTEPWRPLTASATAGPFTVTATARISSVHWNLGEGGTVVCDTAGTEYKVAYGFRAPDCGRANGYQKAGSYKIGATYNWAISWTGAAAGSMTIQTTSSTPAFTVSEYQAVVTHH